MESVDAPAVVGLGTRMPATTRVFGRRWRWTIEVTAFEPPRRLSYRTSGLTTIDVTYALEPLDGGGTRFTFVGSSGSRLAVLAKPTLDREARTALANLEAILDGGGGARPI